jgi:predicted transcriptional regulator
LPLVNYFGNLEMIEEKLNAILEPMGGKLQTKLKQVQQQRKKIRYPTVEKLNIYTISLWRRYLLP